MREKGCFGRIKTLGATSALHPPHSKPLPPKIIVGGGGWRLVPPMLRCPDVSMSRRRIPMTLASFLGKQFIRVIEWNEPEPGILVWRYPMMDQEIENGGKLTVRESEMAAFVNEGKIADIFSPGLYTLATQNLPILTDLMNWSKDFQSPFKSDV